MNVDFSEAITAYPVQWYQKMQQEHPVFYDMERKMWHIFRYKDIYEALSTPDTFASRIEGKESQTELSRRSYFRTLLSRVFSPDLVMLGEKRLVEHAHSLLDRVQARGQMDFVADFASPFAFRVLAEILGIPFEDEESLRYWSYFFVLDEHEEERQKCMQQMDAYFSRLVQVCRRSTSDGLICALAEAVVDGQRLAMGELVAFCELLFAGSLEPLAHLIGSTLLCLSEQPEAYSAVQADTALLPRALEEVLRYRSPVKCVTRRVLQKTQLDGYALAEGDIVNLWLGAANVDPAAFPHAHRFDIYRASNPHLSFGHGMHYCLGKPLVLIGVATAWKVVLQRLPGLHIEPEARLQAVPSSFILGVQHLPVRW
ncbi:cytochrome P450 [Thermosporothrix hazakensis]|jgi:cytochrome P450|uniref:Cytochrome P450 n=2 Tax=Thermosporothrix TaxID=768650 RepID=A0A326U1M9_THEHA|nr:cytochrome P450 [Thermosporothrix hazakensis]PZW23591.1 cytochrome P450 [Thermosporothrix hazakensis]BBH86741.1 cytochrome P450 [Thermosporothrix sp. COM3]GCE51043.1 cytochrome P450 [Thermosporothrix hazakensis]